MARIGTWNLEDLFAVDDEYGPTSPEEYEAKVSAVVETIRGLDVDVLGVQEVGSPDALSDVVTRLGAPWRYSLADPDGRGIRVGFLARVPLRDPEQFSQIAPRLPDVVVDDEGTTTRDLIRPGLRITAELDDVDVQVVVVHFKSRRVGSGPEDDPRDGDRRARHAAYALIRRAAEAATTRILANQLLRGSGARELVVLGDFNDTEHSATTTIVGGSDDEEQRLHNVGTALSDEQRHTIVAGERRELIDHILVSRALLDGLGEAATHDAGDCSDHRPLTVHLTLTAAAASSSASKDDAAEVSAGVGDDDGGASGSTGSGDGGGPTPSSDDNSDQATSSDGESPAASTEDDSDQTASSADDDQATSSDDSSQSASSGDGDGEEAASGVDGAAPAEAEQNDARQPANDGERDGQGSGLLKRARSFFRRSDA